MYKFTFPVTRAWVPAKHSALSDLYQFKLPLLIISKSSFGEVSGTWTVTELLQVLYKCFSKEWEFFY
ncbi:hypothetical protein EMIT0194P_170123 [Pseudomonas serbica]